MLVEGTYYLNRLFATVEMIPKTIIEVGNVGVVVSYTGETGPDLSGEEYRHGELVERGHRGVWNAPLLPGKYAFNTYAGKVVSVPTTNFILKWIRAEVGAHQFDENLTEVSLITKDAFEPSLPLSVVVHIDYQQGSARHPALWRHQEPGGANPRPDGISLLQEHRSDAHADPTHPGTQRHSTDFKRGDEGKVRALQPGAGGSADRHAVAQPNDKQIEMILNQLRSRQIAAEQVETYGRQEKAAVKERELREAESRAQQQRNITESELNIKIQANQGKAEYARALQQAAQIRALAEAEAEKIARIGIAQALATEEQVAAYGGPQFQVTQQVLNRFAEAIQQSGWMWCRV